MIYFFSLSDSHNFVHSIDNVVCDYFLSCSVDSAIKELQKLGSENTGYWEQLNCSSCSKWAFYQNHIHFCDGIYIKIGRYRMVKNDNTLFPVLGLEVNPNKHFTKDAFRVVLDFIREHCADGHLTRYDYAIDLPLEPESIQIFKTRKQHGLYKGTRYFGQRNKHGFCRIYDKAAEQNQEEPLTRVEHVFCTKNKLSFERFCYLTSSELRDLSELTSVKKALVMMALQIKAMGGDYSDALNCMERRRRYELEAYLSGSYTEYEYDLDILNKLLDKIHETFYVDVPGFEKEKLYTDADGFLHYDGENPFD